MMTQQPAGCAQQQQTASRPPADYQRVQAYRKFARAQRRMRKAERALELARQALQVASQELGVTVHHQPTGRTTSHELRGKREEIALE